MDGEFRFKGAEAWQELMIDYAYIPEDWEEARTQLFALLQKDQKKYERRRCPGLSLLLC